MSIALSPPSSPAPSGRLTFGVTVWRREAGGRWVPDDDLSLVQLGLWPRGDRAGMVTGELAPWRSGEARAVTNGDVAAGLYHFRVILTRSSGVHQLSGSLHVADGAVPVPMTGETQDAASPLRCTVAFGHDDVTLDPDEPVRTETLPGGLTLTLLRVRHPGLATPRTRTVTLDGTDYALPYLDLGPATAAMRATRTDASRDTTGIPFRIPLDEPSP